MMVREAKRAEYPQRYADRPDPDEPWRYRCPECGSMAIQHHRTPTKDERRFKCGCGWYGLESELADAREDE